MLQSLFEVAMFQHLQSILPRLDLIVFHIMWLHFSFTKDNMRYVAVQDCPIKSIIYILEEN